MNRPTDNRIRESSAEERLRHFLGESAGEVEPLTPDASTREYFRIRWEGETRVACVYPHPFGDDLPFLDTSRLFSTAGLPVAGIVHVSGPDGIVIQEDLGDLTLGEYLENADEGVKNRLVDDAIRLIARIQSATDLAFQTGSIASKLKFDVEKLQWELGFFLEHYFTSLVNKPLPKSLEQTVEGEFLELARELETFSNVLTHRDFHAGNLLIDKQQGLHIIDHQDARLGSAAYDLVSLLLDRVTEAPDPDWLSDKRASLLRARDEFGLGGIGPEEFEYQFDLAAIQRCLKAIGTFSNQAGNFGKQHYTVYINPMFGIVSGVCRKLNQFPAVNEMIRVHAAENDYESDLR